jgi:hypothetical protein
VIHRMASRIGENGARRKEEHNGARDGWSVE